MVEFCQKTDYHSDPKGALGITKSISGIQRHGHSYEGITGPSVPNRLLRTDTLKAQAFGVHIPEASALRYRERSEKPY